MSDDAEMAQCFADYLEHREASNILSKYGVGYEVVLLKSSPINQIVTGLKTYYKVLILKLKESAPGPLTAGDVGIGLSADGRKEHCEWFVESLEQGFLNAVRDADAKVQQRLSLVDRLVQNQQAWAGQTGPQAGAIGIGAGEQG